MPAGVVGHPPQQVLRSCGVLQVALQQERAGEHRVHVRVLEARRQQPAGEVDDVGAGSGQVAQDVVGSDRRDLPVADGDARADRARRPGGEDATADEERVRRSTAHLDSSDCTCS